MEKKTKETLCLKWGRFKSGNFKDSPEAAKTLEEIHELSIHEVEREKELTCRMIDEWNGLIYNWWEDRYMTKEEAKKYVMEYKVSA